MKRTRLSLVNMNPTIRPVVFAAAQAAFPDAEVLDLPTIEAAGKTGASDLLVLAEPDSALTASATQAVDAGGFPRWAVVILGQGSSDVAEIVPPEEWNPRALARIFRSALLQHDLLCENLRLRGDLKTVARRINHDLRTPAACIHTSSDLLDELSVSKGPALAGVAESFRQSSAEIARLIDRVSFIIRASTDPIPPSPVDMGPVVAVVLRQLEKEIRHSGAVVIQPDSWPEVTGVSAWLEVVWWNLLHNALQHGGPAAQIRVSWIRENDSCRFTVADRGPGVMPTRQAGLFSPFDRLHALRTPGLGLSIVQRLISLQGGRSSHEKLPEAGASFHFTLPGLKPTRTGLSPRG